MSLLLLRTPFAPIPWRRLASVAILALQAAIAMSPAFETREESRVGAHAEEPGSRHFFGHDDAGCAVCSVRTPAAVATPVSTDLFTLGTRRLVPDSAVPVGPTTTVAASNAARAPPLAD